MTEDVLTLIIASLGVATVALSLKVAIKFRRKARRLNDDSKKLTVALKWQLIGEAIIGLGTLVFAVAAYLGTLQHWSLEIQSSIRFSMFFATSITTWHLSRTIDRIEDTK